MEWKTSVDKDAIFHREILHEGIGISLLERFVQRARCQFDCMRCGHGLDSSDGKAKRRAHARRNKKGDGRNVAADAGDTARATHKETEAYEAKETGKVMDARARFKAAYLAMVKARKVHDTWVKRVIAGEAPVNKVRGYRLAKNLDRKMAAFMSASKPFVYWR